MNDRRVSAAAAQLQRQRMPGKRLVQPGHCARGAAGFRVGQDRLPGPGLTVTVTDGLHYSHRGTPARAGWPCCPVVRARVRPAPAAVSRSRPTVSATLCATGGTPPAGPDPATARDPGPGPACSHCGCPSHGESRSRSRSRVTVIMMAAQPGTGSPTRTRTRRLGASAGSLSARPGPASDFKCVFSG